MQYGALANFRATQDATRIPSFSRHAGLRRINTIGIGLFLTLLTLVTSGCGVNLWNYATEKAVKVYLSVKDIDLFTLEKSENKNEAHYAIKVEQANDDHRVKDIWCYWAIYKNGKLDHFEQLMSWEEDGYGVKDKKIGSETSSFAIAGLNTRKINIIEGAVDNKTIFEPKTIIDGQEALLTGVYLDLDRNKIILYGVRWDDRKTPLEEEADPTV